MHTTTTKSLVRSSFLLAAALALTPAIGATVTWDTSTTAGFQSGNGTWGTDSFWSIDGTTLSPWVSGNTATFLGQTTAVNDTITLGSNQTIGGLSFGSATTSGNWTFSGSGLSLSANSTFTVNAGSTAAIGNVITGAFGLTKAGTGDLTLTGVNSYQGMTTVSAGTLTLATGASLGTGMLNVLAGASVAINSSTTVFDLAGAGNVSIANGSTLTTTTATSWNTFSGQLSGSGALVRNNAGEMVFTGDNSGYTGAITMNVGTRISVRNATSSLGSGDLTINGSAIIGTGGFGGYLNNKVIVTAGTTTLGWSGGTLTLAKDFTFGGTSNIVFNSGSIVLGGNLTNTGTGAWGVANGTTLQVGNGGTTGSIEGGHTFNLAAGNLAFKRSDNVTYSGVMSGTGRLWQFGAGNLTLTGVNTYTGETTVSAGTLTLASGASLGTGLLTVGAGATLAINGSTTVANLSGAGNVSIGDGTTLTLNPASSWAEFSGQLSGSGALVKSNAVGQSIFSGDNSNYTGAITLNAGLLKLQNATNSLGSGNLTIAGSAIIGSVASGSFLNNKVIVTAGTVNLGSNNGLLTLAKDVTFSGASSIIFSGTVVLGGNLTNTSTGAWSVATGTTLQVGSGGTTGSIEGGHTFNLAAGNLAFKRSDAVIYSGVLSGTGSLQQSGAGNLTLTGVNTYTGWTTVSAGTLTLASGASLGTGLLTVGAGASIAINSSTTVFDLTGAGNVSIASGSTLTTSTATSWNTFSGQLSGSGALVRNNAGGELVVTGDNSGYTGAITMNAGTRFGVRNATSSLGSGDLTINGSAIIGAEGFAGYLNNKVIVTAGTTTLGYSGGTLTLAKDVTFGGTSNIVFGATVVLGGNLTNTGSGVWSIAGGATLQVGNGGTTGSIEGGHTFNLAAGNLAFKRSDNVTYSGVMSGTGSLRQSGTGNLTLTGVNTYTGVTTVSAGILTIAAVGSTGTGTVTVANGGTLLVNGTAGAVTVANGGTLGGNGTVGNTSVLSGGTIAAGASVGLLTVDNLTLAGGSAMTWQLNDASKIGGVGYDLIIASNLDLSGLSSGSRATLNLMTLANAGDGVSGKPMAFDLALSQSFTLINYTALNLGTNTNVSNLFNINLNGFVAQDGSALNPGNFSVINDAANKSLTLQYVSAVPEPSTYGLALGFLSLAVVAVRRQRRKAAAQA